MVTGQKYQLLSVPPLLFALCSSNLITRSRQQYSNSNLLSVLSAPPTSSPDRQTWQRRRAAAAGAHHRRGAPPRLHKAWVAHHARPICRGGQVVQRRGSQCVACRRLTEGCVRGNAGAGGAKECVCRSMGKRSSFLPLFRTLNLSQTSSALRCCV